MRRVAVEEAGAPVAELLESVERGEEVVITRAGAPVARMVRTARPQDPARNRAILAEAAAFREELIRQGVAPFTQEEIESLINEGRR